MNAYELFMYGKLRGLDGPWSVHGIHPYEWFQDASATGADHFVLRTELDESMRLSALTQTWLESTVQLVQRAGRKAIIRLDAPPDFAQGEGKLWSSPKLQALLVETVGAIAKEFRNNKTVIGIDLLNEPVAQEGGEWYSLAASMLDRIRVESEVPVIVQGGPWASVDSLWNIPGSFLEGSNNVVASFHFYDPQTFTHQGIKADAPPLGTVTYDQLAMLKAMLPLMSFCLQYPNVPVYCGEVGVNRDAPGASSWMLDVLMVLRWLEIGWSVHGYREDPVWSLEGVPRRNDYPMMNVLRTLMKETR